MEKKRMTLSERHAGSVLSVLESSDRINFIKFVSESANLINAEKNLLDYDVWYEGYETITNAVSSSKLGAIFTSDSIDLVSFMSVIAPAGCEIGSFRNDEGVMAIGYICKRLHTSADCTDVVLLKEYVVSVLTLAIRRGYKKYIRLSGTVGHTELGMHTGCADKRGVAAFVNENSTYGYIIMEDGMILDGCFTLFDDGRFSLS